MQVSINNGDEWVSDVKNDTSERSTATELVLSSKSRQQVMTSGWQMSVHNDHAQYYYWQTLDFSKSVTMVIYQLRYSEKIII